MTNTDLPQRWKEKLERFTDDKYGPDFKHRGSLNAYDFSPRMVVNILFPDGSRACFHYAFFIKAPELNEIGVFTEHCGYHIFPLVDLEIEEAEI